MTTTPTPKETWWELTTTTGLILTLPAPLSIGEPVSPYHTLLHRQPITVPHNGSVYTINAESLFLIRQYTKTDQSERLIKARMKLASSPTSSTSGPDRESPSGDRESRRGRSIGGPTKPRTR